MIKLKEESNCHEGFSEDFSKSIIFSDLSLTKLNSEKIKPIKIIRRWYENKRRR